MNTEYQNDLKDSVIGGKNFLLPRLDPSASTLAMLIAGIKIRPLNKALYDPALRAKLFEDVTSVDNTADDDSDECPDGVCSIKPSFIEKLHQQHAEKQTEAG